MHYLLLRRLDCVGFYKYKLNEICIVRKVGVVMSSGFSLSADICSLFCGCLRTQVRYCFQMIKLAYILFHCGFPTYNKQHNKTWNQSLYVPSSLHDNNLGYKQLRNLLFKASLNMMFTSLTKEFALTRSQICATDVKWDGKKAFLSVPYGNVSLIISVTCHRLSKTTEA